MKRLLLLTPMLFLLLCRDPPEQELAQSAPPSDAKVLAVRQ